MASAFIRSTVQALSLWMRRRERDRVLGVVRPGHPLRPHVVDAVLARGRTELRREPQLRLDVAADLALQPELELAHPYFDVFSADADRPMVDHLRGGGAGRIT